MTIAKTVLLLVLGLVPLAALIYGQSPPATRTEEAIQKDQAAALRYIGLRLQKQQSLLKRGREAEAVKLEAECLRQEAKCLERYLWYMRHDPKLKGKAKSLSEALAGLKKKEPKASLEERKKAGFKPSGIVTNPLGLASSPPPPPTARIRSFDSAASDVIVNKPARSLTVESGARFEGAKPPPGAEQPPPPEEGGSAGSGGSFSDH